MFLITAITVQCMFLPPFALHSVSVANYPSVKSIRKSSSGSDSLTLDLNTSSTKHRRQFSPASLNVSEIMSFLEKTYPLGSGATSINQRQQWAKTRKYLYQYRSNGIRSLQNLTHSSLAVPVPQFERTNNKQSLLASSRRMRPKNLNLDNVKLIISFLQSAFRRHPMLQAHILQNSPRILGQYHSIESRLIPTVEFLRGLYDDMADKNGEKGGMIYEAIWRNTDLLLVRGIGYSGRICEEKNNLNFGLNSDVEDFLIESGLSLSEVAELKKRHPSIFQLSVPNKVRPVTQFLSSLLGYQSSMNKKVAKIIMKHPMLLQLDIDSNLSPTANFIQTSCQMTNKELSAVFASNPGVLLLSLKNNLNPTIQFLFNALNSDASKWSTTNTSISHKIDDNKSKILLKKCILRHPQILSLSLNNLHAKVSYFDEIDKFTCSTCVNREDKRWKKQTRRKYSLSSRILMSAPSSYSLSLEESIMPKVEYLASLWNCSVPLSIESIDSDNNKNELFARWNRSDYAPCLSDRLYEYPQILTLSLEENIKATLAFYNMTGYIKLDSNGLPLTQHESFSAQKQAIKSRYIATSLYNRLFPRWYYLIEQQKNQNHLRRQNLEDNVHITIDAISTFTSALLIADNVNVSTKLPPLHLLAGANDKQFCNQMKLSISDYLTYKTDVTPQLKFNSQFVQWLKTGRPIKFS